MSNKTLTESTEQITARQVLRGYRRSYANKY